MGVALPSEHHRFQFARNLGTGLLVDDGPMLFFPRATMFPVLRNILLVQTCILINFDSY